MPTYRVIEGRVMQGYDKASYVYEAGDVVDPAHMVPGHFERLERAGVLQLIADKAPAAGEREQA